MIETWNFSYISSVLFFSVCENTRCWSTDYFPSTVVATWMSTTKDGSVLAAFAVSCIKGRKGSLRMEQNLARQNYNQCLYQLVASTAEELKDFGRGKNEPGNCPEFSTWATVCRQPGDYCTLCLNIALELTMQCCGSYSETRKAANTIGIFIDDRWQTCSLVSVFGEENTRIGGYRVKEMQPIRQILKGGRCRRVPRRKGV